MDFGKVEDWVKGHPLPSAAIGGVALAVVAAVALHGKKGTTQGQYAIPNLLNTAGIGDGTTPGVGGGGVPTLPNDPPWWMQGPPNPPPPPTPTSTAPRTASSNPFVVPQESVFGNIISRGQVSNPLGSAYADAKVNPYYTPSLSDYASELGSGIQRTTAYAPGTPSNYTYTVDNTNLGSGNPVSLANRIPGERYDAYGRVIL